MLRRDNLTRKLVGEMLKIASPVIEFGSTSMGIVETDIGPVAIGKRSIPGTESKLFHILELLGPVLIKEAAEIGEASWMLECLLARAEWMGVSKRIEAVVVDSR